MQELGISAAAQTLVGLVPVKEKKERKPKAARWGWLLEQGGRIWSQHNRRPGSDETGSRGRMANSQKL